MRSVLEVADIFRRHGAAYREAHGRHLSRGQRRVMGAIETCRSAALGGHVEQCNGCGQLRVAYNSCRNRHCAEVPGIGACPMAGRPTVRTAAGAVLPRRLHRAGANRRDRSPQ
jgi:hypothetical protein